MQPSVFGGFNVFVSLGRHLQELHILQVPIDLSIEDLLFCIFCDYFKLYFMFPGIKKIRIIIV